MEPDFSQMGLKQLPRRTLFVAHDRLLSVVRKAFHSLSVNISEWVGEEMSGTDRFMSVIETLRRSLINYFPRVPHDNEFEHDGSPDVPSTDFELKNFKFMQIVKLLRGETYGEDGSNGTRVPNCG
jgi:hypothetical protein